MYRVIAQCFPTKLLHGLVKGISLQYFPGFDQNFHPDTKLGLEFPLHPRNTFFQLLFPVAPESNGQGIFLPLPGSTGQRAAIHGIQGNKHLPQLLRVNTMEQFRRIGRVDRKAAKSVNFRNFPGNILPDPSGQINRTIQGHADGPVLRVQIRSNNGRLRNRFLQRLRRHIVRKHIQEIGFLVHGSP